MTVTARTHPSGPVAEMFAQRIRGLEERTLQARATRSYPAERERPEEDCGLRTPFQRDRDRIVHSKAFRRLKHKTQVFVAPEGDHYRTRLTHTLEVTQVSRTVARALGLNEDLTEAIGLGHDLGHPPFGHIGEDVIDRCLQRRFGRRFKHHEHSLRVVERLERDGAGLNLTRPVRDGILGHSGRAQLPQTLEGRIVRLLDRVAYINHDIDDAVRAGVLDERDLPREPIAALGATGAQRIDFLVHDVVEQSARAGDDIVQSADAARGDVVPARLHVRARLPRARRARRARQDPPRADDAVRPLRRPPGADPAAAAGGRGRPRRPRHRLPRRHDGPLLHPSLRGSDRPRRLRAVSRFTPDSKERVRDAVDMIALVSGKTELRRAGVNSYFGRCPFHDERTGSFHVRPEEKHYHCFGCGESGDPFDFVMQLDGLDFRGALESLASRFGVTLELEDEDPMARARRERRDRLHALLDRAAGYYARYLWESAEAAPARDYLARRGLEQRTLRAFRVGFSPSAWDKMLLGSRQAGFSEEELLATGLAQRSKQRPGSYYDRFRGRIMFPLANARGRVVGFGARAMRDNQPPKYLNSSDGEVFHKSQQLFGIDLARRPAARAGTIVLAEGYTDVIALHQAGIENAVGVMGTSLTEEQARELERTARTLVLALDADGAGQEAMVRASRIAAGRRLELRVARLADGMDPADLVQQQGPGAVRELVAKSVPFVSFHVDKILSGSDLSDAEAKDRTIAELGPVLAAQPPSVLREELIGRIAGRLGIDRALTAQLLERAAASAASAPPEPAPQEAREAAAAPDPSPGPGPEWHDPGPEEPWGGPDPADEAAYWASRSGEDDAAYAAAADAGQVASTRAPVAVRVDARQAKLEREFLVLCIALPREGGQALARVDVEQHLLDPVSRRAVAHMSAVPGRLDALADPSPEDDSALPPADDAELRAFVTQLRELAARSSAMGASLEHAEALLELSRINRAMAAARAAGTGGIYELKRAQGAVRAQLGKLQDQIQASAG